MFKIRLFAFVVVQLFTISLVAQNKDLKEEAGYYFEEKNYKKAYELYDKLSAETPKNLEFKFRLGYSALYYPEKKARAIEIFETLKLVDKSPEIIYYLANAYHLNYKFDDGIKYYTEYISLKGSKIKEDDKPLVKDAQLGIKNCNNGKELIAKKIIADIKNIGRPVNTEELEGVPVISADESILIFTYSGTKSKGGLLDEQLKSNKNGAFREDIFTSNKANDSTWSNPYPIKSLNTLGNDAAVALSPDGTTLFLFVSNNDDGNLYSSTFVDTSWTTPVMLNENINSDSWEGSCSITSDGRFLYFASERPGGLGGRDLYVSQKIDGDWGPAVNLGPQINTEYNEDAPFIHPDGITMFFSSEGHKSIGGYDIMYSIKQENNWIEPLSMGIPLNTTEDDRYYVINAKGDRGYFSSNRGGSGGKGGLDIYTVEPGILGDKPILALLKGNIYADDKPIEAKIEVSKKGTNEAIGPYYANSKTGKYLMALSPGNGYKIRIIVSVPGFEPIEEEMDIEKLTKFVEIKKDFYVYSENFSNKKEQKSVKSLLDSLLGNITSIENFNEQMPEAINTNTVSTVKTKTNAEVKTNTIAEVKTNTTQVATQNPCNGGETPDFNSLKGQSLNIPSNYKQLLDIAGNTCAEGLVFKVQIAAYKYPENYKYNHLKEFGKPEIIKYGDGVTRFTQLQFTTLKEAEAARQKIMAKGQSDAWITAFVGEKRYTLEELIMVNFLGKSIN